MGGESEDMGRRALSVAVMAVALVALLIHASSSWVSGDQPNARTVLLADQQTADISKVELVSTSSAATSSSSASNASKAANATFAPTFTPLDYTAVKIPYFCFPYGNCKGLYQAMQQHAARKRPHTQLHLEARKHKMVTADQAMASILAAHGESAKLPKWAQTPSSPLPGYLDKFGVMHWGGAFDNPAPFATNMEQQIASYHGQVRPHFAEDPKIPLGKPDTVPLGS